MLTSRRQRAFHGSFVHSLNLRELEFAKDALIGDLAPSSTPFIDPTLILHALLGINEDGIIEFIDRDCPADEAAGRLSAREGWSDCTLIALTTGEFLIPGYV